MVKCLCDTVNVCFKSKYDWALLPYKHQVERRTPAEDAQMYAQCFRWVRKTRTAAACWPWRAAQELGWVIPSPVDVLMTPLQDVEIACPPDDLDLLSRSTRLAELWKRNETYIALETTNWMRLYDVRTASGWEAMFVPNGEGTVEWHLGWEIEIPDKHYLLVLPAPDPPPGLDIPMGVLDAKTLRRRSSRQGMSIAVRPTQAVRIQRRQPVARVLLLSADSLHADASVDGSTGKSAEMAHLQPHPAGLLHHVELNVSDLARSRQFWDWMLADLGYTRYQEWEQGVSWKLGATYIVFVQTAATYVDPPYHRRRTGLNHLAFHAHSREHVDHMAKDLEQRGVPILYRDKHPYAGGPDHYAVFFEDPDRIKVELVAPDPDDQHKD